jgi:uncharacterized protein YndB with AHSA1/START domain
VERREAEAIYDAGREVVVEVLLRMDRQIQQLTARVDNLERELAKNSRNSSRPPSSDPPSARKSGKPARSKGAGLPPLRRTAARVAPLAEVDAWLEDYRALWVNRLDALHTEVARTSPEEESPMKTIATMRALDGQLGAIRVEDVYDTDIEDLWEACTEPGRLARWIAEVSGDLRLGGAFHATFTSSGAGAGRIEACDPPHHLLLTMLPGTDDEQQLEAWLAREEDKTRLTVENRGLPLGELLLHWGWLAGTSRRPHPVSHRATTSLEHALDRTDADLPDNAARRSLDARIRARVPGCLQPQRPGMSKSEIARFTN